MILNIIAWLMSGIVAGCVAAYLRRDDGDQFAPYLMLGVIGAVIGGFIGIILSSQALTNFNSMSAIIALIGSLILIGLYGNISSQSW